MKRTDTAADPLERDLLIPVPRVGLPRVIGPGRIERGYRERLAGLEAELDTARLVERGAARRQDRLETELTRAAESAEEARRVERRLILALGALQGENAELRRRLERTEHLLAAPAPAPRPGLLSRLFPRRRAPRRA